MQLRHQVTEFEKQNLDAIALGFVAASAHGELVEPWAKLIYRKILGHTQYDGPD